MLFAQMPKDVLSAREPLMAEGAVLKGLTDMETFQVEGKWSPIR